MIFRKNTKSRIVFPWKIFIRVVVLQSCLLLFALLVSGLVARTFYKKQLLYNIEARLTDSLQMMIGGRLKDLAGTRISQEDCDLLVGKTSLSLAIFNKEGSLICASNPQEPRLQAAAKEVVEAIKTGKGTSVRVNESDRREYVFVALLKSATPYVVRLGLSLDEMSQDIRWFDTSFVVSLFLFVLLFGAATWWSGKKLVFPLGRIILKTRNLLEKKHEELSLDEIATDSFGEWQDLESNIDVLRKSLEEKSQILDTERFELATLMASISDAILAVDHEDNILFYNSRLEILVGRIQKKVKLWEFFRDPNILEAFENALKKGHSVSTKAIAFSSPSSQQKVYYSLSVSPLRNPHHKIYAAVGVFHNVTELKSAEQMRIDFVANVSHELRTPLTSIKGYVETLSQDLQAGRPISKEFLDIILKNSNRLMNLMEDLLDLSSIESDQVLLKENLSTEDITTKVVRGLDYKFSSKNQKVVTDYSAKNVFADEKRLEQVLTNLLDNAHKYTPEGGSISVMWKSEGAFTILEVKDSGPGIPEEHQSRIFERFYRVDKARSRELGGTGLGLAIVKHILQRHEGTIGVRSKVGAGATFYCSFPAP